MSDGVLSEKELRALPGLNDWRAVVGALETRFRSRDFATGLELVNRIGAAAEAADHHPDLELRYATVRVVLTSHDAHGITMRDVELARTISQIASDVGAAAEPSSVQPEGDRDR